MVFLIVYTVLNRTVFLLYFYSFHFFVGPFTCLEWTTEASDCSLRGQNKHLWLSMQSVPLVTSSRFNLHR